MISPYPSTTSRRTLFVASLAMAMGLCGCSRGIALIPVCGEVKLDGAPLVDCAVTFAPLAGGPVASGTTDAQGQFQLSTVNRPGAVPGEHRVALTKQRYVGEPGRQRYIFITPEKYAKPETSGFRKTVDQQNHEFTFELTSK
jgi:hypothetical protein